MVTRQVSGVILWILRDTRSYSREGSGAAPTAPVRRAGDTGRGRTDHHAQHRPHSPLLLFQDGILLFAQAGNFDEARREDIISQAEAQLVFDGRHSRVPDEHKE